MLKPFLLALITACGASTPPSEDRPIDPPEPDGQDDQHFCCKSVDLDSWTGEDCVAISKETINACSEVLYCPGLWGKSGGITKCSK